MSRAGSRRLTLLHGVALKRGTFPYPFATYCKSDPINTLNPGIIVLYSGSSPKTLLQLLRDGGGGVVGDSLHEFEGVFPPDAFILFTMSPGCEATATCSIASGYSVYYLNRDEDHLLTTKMSRNSSGESEPQPVPSAATHASIRSAKIMHLFGRHTNRCVGVCHIGENVWWRCTK